MEESEARRLAEEFGRTLTDRWDEWAFRLGLWATPAVMGVYGFTWYPTAKDEEGRQIRVGGIGPSSLTRARGRVESRRGRKRWLHSEARQRFALRGGATVVGGPALAASSSSWDSCRQEPPFRLRLVRWRRGGS